MDINLVLAIIVAISAVQTVWDNTRIYNPRVNRGWVAISVFTLCVMGAVWVIQPAWTGWISFAIWLMFVITPSILARYSNRLVNQEKYNAAILMQQIVRLLHPFDQYRALPDITLALRLESLGDIAGASAILKNYADDPQWRFYVTTKLFRLSKQYDALLRWWRDDIGDTEYRRDPSLLSEYLRVLGAVGDLNAMLQEFVRLKTASERVPYFLAYNYLVIFSYCGKQAQVEILLESVFMSLSQNAKRLWLAIAQYAAGDTENGRQQFNRLAESSTGLAHQSALRYRDKPPVVANDVLTSESRELLAQLEQDFESLKKSVQVTATRGKFAVVTWTLIALNLLVFVVELLRGGVENMDTLYTLGALWPPAVIQGGEWWRVVAAMFLHYGVAHLALNMLALYRLGRSIEAVIGRLRFGIVYFAAGIGSSLALLALTQAGITPVGLYVGASGAIMGLVGALAAITLINWRTGGQRLARSELYSVLFIIGLQVLIDVLIPGISLEGHLSGTAIGFLVMLVILLRRTRPAPQ